MLYCVLSVIFITSSILLLKKTQVAYAISKAWGLGIALSLLASIALAQNYAGSATHNPEGISISNSLAYFIIGEQSERILGQSVWSVTIFRDVFEVSMYVTLVLILCAPLVYGIEHQFTKRNSQKNKSS